MSDENGGQSVRLWDWPVRLIHWSFVLLIPALWWSVRTGRLDLHEKLGLTMLGLVVFRLIWGVVGSSTARFARFLRGPAGIIAYLRGSDRDGGSAPVGHNPLGGLSVAALLGLLTAQVSLGLFAQDTDGIASGPLNHLVSWDQAVAATAAHALVFNLLLGLIGLHLAAILYYRVMKRENLVKPMLSGKKTFATPVAAPWIAPWWRAAVVAVIAVVAAVWISWGLPPWGANFPWNQPAVMDDQSFM